MRALLSLAVLVGVLSSVVPAASAQQAQPTGAIIDITAVVLPEQTVAGNAFDVSLTLTNRGTTERNVSLMAALYLPRSASEPACGAATSPRFRNFTHLYQPVFRIRAGETIEYPHPGNTAWKNLYFPNDVGDKPAEYEMCVFAAESEPQQSIDYFDYHSSVISVRASNSAPRGDFSFSPVVPTATESVRFEATGSDPDGDPLTYSWDFGHLNASGRASAEGLSAVHPFYPAGTYTVTLTISDGFEETRVSRTLTVAPEPVVETPTVVPTTQEANATPLPVTLAFAALAGTALSVRIRRRS